MKSKPKQPTQYCCAHLSIGSTIVCEKKLNHKGPHSRTGNSGNGAYSIPFKIKWYNDSRLLDKGLLQGYNID